MSGARKSVIIAPALRRAHGKLMSFPGDSAGFGRAGEDVFAARLPACPACGARARRAGARYCSTCGRGLDTDYCPTDSLRASYRFERLPPAADSRYAARGPRPRRGRTPAARVRVKRGIMPTRNAGDAAATARAFVTYALVPYLGILFCPGALLLGFVGLLRPGRGRRGARARRDSAVSFALGLLLLCAQLVLWWILYKVPEWSRQAGNF